MYPLQLGSEGARSWGGLAQNSWVLVQVLVHIVNLVENRREYTEHLKIAFASSVCINMCFTFGFAHVLYYESMFLSIWGNKANSLEQGSAEKFGLNTNVSSPSLSSWWRTKIPALSFDPPSQMQLSSQLYLHKMGWMDGWKDRQDTWDIKPLAVPCVSFVACIKFSYTAVPLSLCPQSKRKFQEGARHAVCQLGAGGTWPVRQLWPWAESIPSVR